MIFRPYKRIRQCQRLVGALSKQIEIRQQLNDSQMQMIESQERLIAALQRDNESLKKDLSLVQMASASPVDPRLRDSILEPEPRKTWVN